MMAVAETSCAGQKFRDLGLPPCGKRCGNGGSVCLYTVDPENPRAIVSSSLFAQRNLNMHYSGDPTPVEAEKPGVVNKKEQPKKGVTVFISSLLKRL